MKFLPFLITFLSFHFLTAQQFTIELYTKRVKDDFHQELKEPIQSLGFDCIVASKNARNCDFKTTSTNSDNFIIDRYISYNYLDKKDSVLAQTLCIGRFTSYESAYKRLTTDDIIGKSFAKAAVRIFFHSKL